MINLFKKVEIPKKKRAKRRLVDIDIDEISIVTNPAMPSATFTIRKEDQDAAASLRSGLSEILAGARSDLPPLPDAAAVIKQYKADYPDDVLAGIQTFATAILEILDAPPVPTTENIPDAAGTVRKSEGDWPSLGAMTVPLLNLVNPKMGSRLLQKAAEKEGPDPRDEEIDRLIDENKRLRSSRLPSSQKPYIAEFDTIAKAEDDDVEDRWPSVHLFRI